MAPTKKRSGVAIPGPTSTSDLSFNPSTSLATDPLPIVKVNTANLNEIKAALDDIVKEYLTDQSFTPSNLNPAIHLALGYSSVLVSMGGMGYSLLVNFEESKPILWISVIGYFLLQGALWSWKRWVEKGEVFRGKRRRVIKRIETDHVQITTTTSLDKPTPPQVTFSPHTRPSTPSPSGPSSPRSISSMELPSSDNSPPASQGEAPTYLLHLELSTTSNNGKSLIRKSRVVSGRGVGQFVDEDGGVEQGEVRRWVAGLLSDAGLVGAEEEGQKVE